MTSLDLLLQDALHDYFCKASHSAVARSCFACARKLFLKRDGYLSLQLSSVTGTFVDLVATNEADASIWSDLQCIFQFYSADGRQLQVEEIADATADISAAFLIEKAACSGLLGSRQLLFEAAALAEKIRGNDRFKAADYGDALESYTRALCLLGFNGADSIDTPFQDSIGESSASSQHASRSVELMTALFSNRSACQLKLGHARLAVRDAEFALVMITRRFPEGPSAQLLLAWSKAKHRSASALVRLGRFCEALAILNEIDKKVRSRSVTSSLRLSINSLRKVCSPANSYASLQKHLLEQRDLLLVALRDSLRNEDDMCWHVILSNFMDCPLLFLLDIPELRKLIRKAPGRMSNLVRMIQRGQDPVQPYSPTHQEAHNAMKLENMIEHSYNSRAEQRQKRQELEALRSASSRDGFMDAISSFGLDVEDSDEEDEEVPQREILLLRWLLSYLALDARKWTLARVTLERLIFHVTVNPEAPNYYPEYITRMKSPATKDFRHTLAGDIELNILCFPRCYLPELTYLLALANFGLGDWKGCGSSVAAYFDLVTEGFNDHNYGDALYLQAWAELKFKQHSVAMAAFENIRHERLRLLANRVCEVDRSLTKSHSKPFEDLYDGFTWVRGRCYYDLGCRPLPGEYQTILERVEQEDARMKPLLSRRSQSDDGDPFGDNAFESFTRFDACLASFIGVTQRYRMTLGEKTKSQRRDDRNHHGLGPCGFPDMEQDLYEMQQDMFSSVMNMHAGFGRSLLGNDGSEEESEDEDSEEDELQEIPGGFAVGEEVSMCSTLSISGQRVCKRGDKASVVGPSGKNADLVCIQLAHRRDGKAGTISVPPQRITSGSVVDDRSATGGSSADTGGKSLHRNQKIDILLKLLDKRGEKAAKELRDRVSAGRGATAKNIEFTVDIIQSALELWTSLPESAVANNTESESCIGQVYPSSSASNSEQGSVMNDTARSREVRPPTSSSGGPVATDHESSPQEFKLQ